MVLVFVLSRVFLITKCVLSRVFFIGDWMVMMLEVGPLWEASFAMPGEEAGYVNRQQLAETKLRLEVVY